MSTGVNALRRPISSVAVSAVALALLASCADDEPAISKEAYIARATEICQETQEAIVDQSEAVDTDAEGAVAELIQVVAVEMLDQVDQLEAIPLPDEGAGTLSRAFATYRSVFRSWQVNPDEAVSTTSTEKLATATEDLEQFGLADCTPSEG